MADIRAFKREHELAPADAAEAEGEAPVPGGEADEQDLRAEDDALVAAALEAEREAEEEVDEEESTEDEGSEDEGSEDSDEERPRRRRRGSKTKTVFEGTFDHGEEGYGLWLDPEVADAAVYAEHWAGHRPVTVTVEAERIVITRSGEEPEDSDD